MPPAYPQVTFEEMRVEAAVKAAVEGTGAQLRAHWGGATLQPPQDLPFPLEQLPKSFGARCARWGLGRWD